MHFFGTTKIFCGAPSSSVLQFFFFLLSGFSAAIQTPNALHTVQQAVPVKKIAFYVEDQFSSQYWGFSVGLEYGCPLHWKANRKNWKFEKKGHLCGPKPSKYRNNYVQFLAPQKYFVGHLFQQCMVVLGADGFKWIKWVELCSNWFFWVLMNTNGFCFEDTCLCFNALGGFPDDKLFKIPIWTKY